MIKRIEKTVVLYECRECGSTWNDESLAELCCNNCEHNKTEIEVRDGRLIKVCIQCAEDIEELNFNNLVYYNLEDIFNYCKKKGYVEEA